MKKTFIWVLIAIASGVCLGLLTFNKYEDLEVQKVISYSDNVYALYYNSYKTVSEMQNKIKDIERYIYINDGKEISVYLALSAKENNIEKLKKIYDEDGIETKIVKINIDNDEFIQNLNEYEKLLDATEMDSSLIIIENQILSTYEKLVIQDE